MKYILDNAKLNNIHIALSVHVTNEIFYDYMLKLIKLL